ncbi:MAG: protein translocase subunit SecD, partial [Actinobacteria bacterium]|nr:protein translocase subunit SecD [Actinomycetota bacterium]
GLSVVLQPKQGQRSDQATLQQAANIISLRIDQLGVAEPDIAVQGNTIQVQLPGIKDPSAAIKLIGTTAQLRMRPVLGVVAPGQKLPAGIRDIDCSNPNTWPNDDPSKQLVFCSQDRDAAGKVLPQQQWTKLALGPAALEGSDISDASAQLPSTQTVWEVNLKLSSQGGKKFASITGQLACNQGITRQLAIVLDRVVESHPQISDGSGGGTAVQCHVGIAGGTAVITGNFSEKEAKDLGLVLKFGALPLELERSTTTTISPSLGRDSLRGGLLAGAIGLAIVFLYVLVFYRGLGLIIWIGLLIHSAFTLGVVIILGETAGFALSLAGIAGLIVSLGVATDSFIVYFERIKDEAHHGRTLRASVDRAWGSAWRTIVAADLVTALAAAVLYILAVGSVRGFALMLGLATALDLFVAAWFMHPSVWLLAQTKRFSESKTLGVGSVAGYGIQPLPVSGGRE